MAGCYLLSYLLFVYLSVLAVLGATHIKGLYCQDPDTGKLYPINATWPSETFCGNYTCKLRQKNLTQTEYEPIAKINITALEGKNKTLTSDMDTSPSEQAFIVIKKVHPTKQPASYKDTIDRINSIKDELKTGTDADRYLTEAEIKSITEILHTVKKSDLEAIVEIYNIAQEIYKEIGSNLDENNIKNDTTTAKAENNNIKKKLKSNAIDSVSYWYDPLHHVNTKVKPNDLNIEGSNPVPTARSYSHPATYFKGPFTEKDFRPIPYYYPISDFQRMSSYINYKTPQNLQNLQNVPHYAKPCNKKLNNYSPIGYNIPTKQAKSDLVKPQVMQPMLLPYPFSYVNNYNFSAYPSSYYYKNYYPWAQLGPYSSLPNHPQNYYGAYLSKVPKSVQTVAENVEEIDKKPDVMNINSNENIYHKKEGEKFHLPEWQTEDLSPEILEEVKANILEDSKLLKSLNIAKNIKLEKVGKVIKLDELTRTKRDTNNIDIELENTTHQNEIQYETYVDKTTCESSIELGYFRMGNLTEPYPACCPQKIS